MHHYRITAHFPQRHGAPKFLWLCDSDKTHFTYFTHFRCRTSLVSIVNHYFFLFCKSERTIFCIWDINNKQKHNTNKTCQVSQNYKPVFLSNPLQTQTTLGSHYYFNLRITVPAIIIIMNVLTIRRNPFSKAETLNSNSKYWMPAEPSGFHSN